MKRIISLSRFINFVALFIFIFMVESAYANCVYGEKFCSVTKPGILQIANPLKFSIAQYTNSMTCPASVFPDNGSNKYESDISHHTNYPNNFCVEEDSNLSFSGWQMLRIPHLLYRDSFIHLDSANNNDGCSGNNCGTPSSTLVFSYIGKDLVNSSNGVNTYKDDWKHERTITDESDERKITSIPITQSNSSNMEYILLARSAAGDAKPDPRWYNLKLSHSHSVSNIQGLFSENVEEYAIGHYNQSAAIECPGVPFGRHNQYDDFCLNYSDNKIISGWSIIRYLDAPITNAIEIEVGNFNDGCSGSYCGTSSNPSITDTIVYYSAGYVSGWQYLTTISTTNIGNSAKDKKTISLPIPEHVGSILLARGGSGDAKPDPRWYSVKRITD
ncbi:hypothetical protein BVY03_00660 [bacterium K02(2017)]|nr:hypothetical protein BVY03_00660 [bacterium K02(2017)]